MNKQSDDEQLNRILELQDKVVNDNSIVLLQLEIRDLMALIFMTGDWIMDNALYQDMVGENTLKLWSYLIDTVRKFHPEYIDSVFAAGTTEEALENIKGQARNKLNGKESEDNNG